MSRREQKASAEWKFIVTFIKLFEPHRVTYDKVDREWWIDNDVECIDIGEWHWYRHI